MTTIPVLQYCTYNFYFHLRLVYYCPGFYNFSVRQFLSVSLFGLIFSFLSCHPILPHGDAIKYKRKQRSENKAPLSLTQRFPEQHSAWHSAFLNNTQLDTALSRTTLSLTQRFPEQHAAWHSASPNNNQLDTVLSRKHSAWHSTFSNKTQFDSALSQTTLSLT